MTKEINVLVSFRKHRIVWSCGFGKNLRIKYSKDSIAFLGGVNPGDE